MDKYKKQKAEALKMYLNARGDITYTDIARAVLVHKTTISNWKDRYNWEEQLEEIMSGKKVKEPENEEELQENLKLAEEIADQQFDLLFKTKGFDGYEIGETELSRDDPSSNLVEKHGKNLNEREKVFLKYYLLSFNSTRAARIAFPEIENSNIFGRSVLQRPQVQKAMKLCKDNMTKDLGIRAYDIVERYMKIAFADLFDYITIEFDYEKDKQVVKLRHDIEKIDTTPIKKIYRNRNGIVVELEDRHKALEKLTEVFDAVPDVWRREMEEAYLKLKEKEVENKIELQNQEENKYRGHIILPMMSVIDRPDSEEAANESIDLQDVLSRNVEEKEEEVKSDD